MSHRSMVYYRICMRQEQVTYSNNKTNYCYSRYKTNSIEGFWIFEGITKKERNILYRIITGIFMVNKNYGTIFKNTFAKILATSCREIRSEGANRLSDFPSSTDRSLRAEIYGKNSFPSDTSEN